MSELLTTQDLDAAMEAVEQPVSDLGDAPISTFLNKDGHVQPYPVAMYLIDKRSVKTISAKKREIYIYEDGIYVDGENILRKDVRLLLGAPCTNRHVSEVIELIKDQTIIAREEFEVDANLINLNNGVLDLRTREFHPHSPKHHFLVKIPVDYDPAADCPAIKKFFSDVLSEKDIPHIQECFGFGIYRKYFLKKAYIFVGERDTGKSTMLRLFHALFGSLNISGVSLHKLSGDKFSTANLYTKLLNIFDELSSKDINDSGNFKMVTGGSPIPGEFKYGSQFMFENYAKLIFASNKIPDVKDAHDEAYFSRFIILPFNNIVDEDQRDPFLMNKLTTPQELSGLLNFALEGLQRLLKNGKFSYNKTPDEIKTEMMRSGSVVANFAYDCLEEEEGAWVTKEDAHAACADYARSRGLPIPTLKRLGSTLPKYAPYLSEGRPVTMGKQITGTAWMNVRIKVESTPASPEEDPFNLES